MRGKIQQVALITLGAILGILITLNFSAVAEKSAAPLPNRGLARVHRGLRPCQERLRRTRR